jgi:hypothetical protein
VTTLWAGVLTPVGREVPRDHRVGGPSFDPAVELIVVVSSSIPRFPDGVPVTSSVSATIRSAQTGFAPATFGGPASGRRYWRHLIISTDATAVRVTPNWPLGNGFWSLPR